MKHFISYFFYGNIWISIGSVCYLQTTLWLLGLQIDWLRYVVVFLATYCTYQLSFLGLKYATSAKFDLPHRQIQIFKYTFWTSCFLLLGCIVYLSILEILFLAHLAMIAILYTQSLDKLFPYFQKYFFVKITPLRIQPYLKTLWVSYVWVAMVVIFPHLTQKITLTWAIFLPLCGLFVARFLCFWALVLPFDSRDSEADKKMGLKTIYNSLLQKYYNILIFAILLLSFALHSYLYPPFFLLFMVIHSTTLPYYFLST